MRINLFRVGSSLLGLYILAGCAANLSPIARMQASSQVELQQDTAFAIGGNLSPGQVNISKVQIPPECLQCVITWHAVVPVGEFNCSGLITPVDDSVTVAKPVCVKQ